MTNDFIRIIDDYNWAKSIEDKFLVDLRSNEIIENIFDIYDLGMVLKKAIDDGDEYILDKIYKEHDFSFRDVEELFSIY